MPTSFYDARAALCLILCTSLITVCAPGTAQTLTEDAEAVQMPFTFGLWGWDAHPVNLGLEGLLRDMRRHNMNCLVASPRLYGAFDPGAAEATAEKHVARLKDEVALCARYGVYVLPYVGATADEKSLKVTLDDARHAAEALKNAPNILAWYIRDEPPPEFLPSFLEYSSMLEQVAPRQSALCLFYRPDSAAAFAAHQPVLLTDCYPIGYMHDGTSIGPHFAVKGGPLAMADNLGRFSTWGTRGILEWMDLCRSLTGEHPHWITLQVFESGDGRNVRWRQPTVPELRLQTWLAIAGGAKGINYFRYSYLTDEFGNPRPSMHGEETPLWDEIARLGAQLIPLGAVLVNAEVAAPAVSIATWRPTPAPGLGIEVRRLRARSRDVDYLVAFNNDVLIRNTADISLSQAFVRERRIVDLETLAACSTERRTGALLLPVALPPGGGKLFCIAPEEEARRDIEAILKGRCANESGILELDIRLAEESAVDLSSLAELRASYRATMHSRDYADALRSIRACAQELEDAFERDVPFRTVRENLAWLRGRLALLGNEAPERHAALNAQYRELLAAFHEGNAPAITGKVQELRQVVEQELESRQTTPMASDSIPID